MLTPTRYLWSGYEDYFKNYLLRFISSPLVRYLRFWDKIAAQRPDKILAISSEVKQRIRKYYDLTSEVINLPVSPLPQSEREEKDEDYYLIVSRLVYYKRIDIAIKAFNALGLKLKIIGVGSEEKILKNIAGRSIEFLGHIEDEKLSAFYQNSKGLIFPGREDFGLVMVEAQSYGKPVLAFRGGGALDIVKEGITGDFFDVQNEEVLEKSLEKFNNKRYNAKLCMENGLSYTYETFKESLLKAIN
jgi:glycosyltransferase involved in cell wall biosynthesis